MAKMIKCKTCGADIAKSAKVCPQCGAKNKKPPIALIVIGAILVIGIISSVGGGGNSGNKNTVSNAASHISTPKPTNTPEPEEKSISDFKFDTSEYYSLTANVLYKYGKYMAGEKVLTQLNVSSTSNSYFQSNTANEESFTYAFRCDFDSNSVKKQLEKDSNVTVAAIVSDESTEKTIKLKNCVIVSDSNFVPEENDVQIEYCTAFKTAYEEAVATALKEEREQYATDCVSLDYNDIARNPDSHKGEKVKFSGKVIQVSEGFFNSVTYRIATKGGYDDVVYVTYTREEGESRILDGDSITVYGECDGITSYMTVLGSTITIPEVKMKYYE